MSEEIFQSAIRNSSPSFRSRSQHNTPLSRSKNACILDVSRFHKDRGSVRFEVDEFWSCQYSFVHRYNLSFHTPTTRWAKNCTAVFTTGLGASPNRTDGWSLRVLGVCHFLLGIAQFLGPSSSVSLIRISNLPITYSNSWSWKSFEQFERWGLT